MPIGGGSILISTASGFVGGLLASIFATGVRKMLAKSLLPHKIQLGEISKSLESEDRYFPFYYVPVFVQTSKLNVLFMSDINDVRADITFVNQKDNIESRRHYSATWYEQDNDSPSITFTIGEKHEYRIRIATISSGFLKAVGSINEKDILLSDNDLLVEIKSGNNVLGEWLYEKAVIESTVQSIEPTRRLK